MNDFSIIVHGGAWAIPDEAIDAHKEGCRLAVQTGLDILNNGGSALDAVEAAVVILENDPAFDAGRGAFLNKAGEVELDASIMEGEQLRAGAVAAVSNFKNPVQIARAVMEFTDHVLLTADGAEEFALSRGFQRCATEELLVGRELERYLALKKNKDFRALDLFRNVPKGTVGAVARDASGLLAAATSTGGTPHKLKGRVGDTPIIGAGTFADNRTGAASATGWGEGIMRMLLAKRVCDLFAGGLSAQKAVKEGIGEMQNKVNGFGGIIFVSPAGEIAFAFNTPRMAYAYYDRLKQCIVAGI